MRHLVLIIVCIVLGLIPALCMQEGEASLGRFDTELLKSLPEKVPCLLPTWTGSPEEGLQLTQTLGFTLYQLAPEQSILGQICENADTDPNLIYRQRFPYPEIRPAFTRHTTYGEAIAGIVHPPSGIMGYRQRFRWRFPGASRLRDLEQSIEVVWHWLPPEGWGIENPVPGTARLNDRYQGAILRARKKEGTGWLYAVVSFDALIGERWLTPLPVWEALERLQSLTNEAIVPLWEKADTSGPGGSTRLMFSFSITRDGSHTLVVVGNPEDAAHSLLFVLDAKGVLLRTRVLPGMALDRAISRDFADSVFLLKMNRQSGKRGGPLLVNGDGEVLGWFAKHPDENVSPSVTLYSDGLAWDQGAWGAY